MVSTVGEIFCSWIEVCQSGKYTCHMPTHVGRSIKRFGNQSIAHCSWKRLFWLLAGNSFIAAGFNMRISYF